MAIESAPKIDLHTVREWHTLIGDIHYDFQAIGRAIRHRDTESKELTDLRKEIQQLQVKLNRAKLARNKQEIRKFEDELKWKTKAFSQAQMFDTLSSQYVRKPDLGIFDSYYSNLATFYPRVFP